MLTPTKTLRWSSVLRMFSVSIPWAFAVAVVSKRLAESGDLPVGAAGPMIGIASVFEEAMKLVPLAVFGVLAPGRVRRFGATDWLLLGFAAGMGFQVAEDFVRRVTYEPTALSLLLGEQQREYGLTLFGGSFDYQGAVYVGHHVETALVAGLVGIAIQLSRRQRSRWRWCWWLLPVVALAVAIVDHAGFNATVTDPGGFPAGRSTVPTLLYRAWDWSGQGHGRTWLLVVVAVAALLVDAIAIQARTLPPPRRLPPPGTDPAVVGGERSAGTGLPARLWTSVTAVVRRAVRVTVAGYRRADPAPLRRRLVEAWLAANRERARRELAMSGPGGRSSWTVTRWSSFAVGALLAFGGAALGVALSNRIGWTLIPTGGGWFADLLDALGDWWDGLGPGGQGLVLLGGLGMIALGLLVPAMLAVAGGGVMIAGASMSPGLVVVGGGVTTIALLAQAASGGSDGTSGGRSREGGSAHGGQRPWKSLRTKERQIAARLGYTEKQVRDAIHAAKKQLVGEGSRRNPDVYVDIETGSMYPKLPGGAVGEEMGSIYHYLP